MIILNDPFAGGHASARHLRGRAGVLRRRAWSPRWRPWRTTPTSAACAAGSMSPYAEECYQEGLRIPPLEFYVGGVPEPAVYALIRANCRIPESCWATWPRSWSPVDTGEAGPLRLIEHHGEEAAPASARSARLHRGADAARRSDRSRRGRTASPTTSTTTASIPVGPISVTITIADGSVTMDFEGSSPQVKASLTARCRSPSRTPTAAMRTLLRSDIPNNAGFFGRSRSRRRWGASSIASCRRRPGPVG